MTTPKRTQRMRLVWARTLLLEAALEALVDSGVLDEGMLAALEQQDATARTVDARDAPMLRAYALVAQARLLARDADLGEPMTSGAQAPDVLAAMVSALDVANDPEALIEHLADAAHTDLGSASMAVSRWNRRAGVLEVMVNVGELGPGEERRPDDETYPLEQYPAAQELLNATKPYRFALENEMDDASRSVLRWCGKRSQAAVPVHVNGRVWGELWASSGFGEPALEDRAVDRLRELAADIGRAMAGAERLRGSA